MYLGVTLVMRWARCLFVSCGFHEISQLGLDHVQYENRMCFVCVAANVFWCFAVQPLWCEDVMDAGVQQLSACLGAFDESVVRRVSLVRSVRSPPRCRATQIARGS